MQLVSSFDQLEEALAVGDRTPILLGGELVYVSSDIDSIESVTNAESIADQYVQQPPRVAARGSATFAKDKARLFVAVQKAAILACSNYKNGIYLLADQYLAYGLSLKTNVIVIGGGVFNVESLNIEVFVFTGQKLVKTVERTSSNNGALVDAALQDIMQEFPEHAIHWCSPLPPPPFGELSRRMGFAEVGDAPLRSLVKRKVFSKAQTNVEPTGWLPAASLVLLGGAIFAAGAGLQWSNLTSARAEYKNEILGYEEAYQNSTQSLDLLRHRDYLLKTEAEHKERVQLIDLMLSHVAQVDGVIIEHIRFYDGDAANNQAIQSSFGLDGQGDDFSISIKVPIDEAAGSARDQAEPLLAELTHKTGMTIRVIDHSQSKLTIGKTDRHYWNYRLGGTTQ